MGVNKFVSIENPYVHSRSKNFSQPSNIKSFRLSQKQSNVNPISLLERMRDQLRTATDSFLAGTGISSKSNNLMKDLNDYLLKKNDKLVNAALRVLYEPGFLEALTPTFTAEDFNFKNLSKPLQKAVADQETISAMAKAYANALGTRFYQQKSRDDQIQAFAKLFDKGDLAVIEKIFIKDAEVKRTLTSKKGKIVEVVEKYLVEKMPENKTSLKKALDYFDRSLKEKTKDINQRDVDEYLKRFHTLLTKSFNEGKFDIISSTQHAKGALGENVIAEVINSANETGFLVEVIGGKKEDDVRKEQLGDLEKEIPKLFKSSEKYSYSDLVIELNGKKARVQSKNAYGSLQALLQKKTRYSTAALQLLDKHSYTSLLKALSQSHNGMVSQEVLSEMSYLLANAYWFSKSKGAFRNMGEVPSLNEVTSEIEEFLRLYISDFLGVVWQQHITEKVDSLKVYTDISNLFFLVSNAVLVPTYLIIEELIKSLKDQESVFEAKIKVQLQRPTITVNSATFYEQKMAALEGADLKAGVSRYPEPLLAVGKSKGEEIISNYSIAPIKINLRLDQLLKITSFNG